MLALLRGPSWFPSFPVLPIGSPFNHLYLAPPSGLPAGNRPTQLTAHLTLSSGCLNGTIQSPCPKLTSCLFLKMQSCPLSSSSFFFSFFILRNNITLSQLVRLKLSITSDGSFFLKSHSKPLSGSCWAFLICSLIPCVHMKPVRWTSDKHTKHPRESSLRRLAPSPNLCHQVNHSMYIKNISYYWHIKNYLMQADLVLLGFTLLSCTATVLYRDWSFVTSRCWVSLSGPFFQHHLLTSCLCAAFSAILTTCQVISLSYTCYGDLWSVISDDTTVIDSELHASAHTRWQTQPINTVCVLSAPLTGCSITPLPFFRPPYSLRHNKMEMRPINNRTMALKGSTERKFCLSL